MRFDFNMYVLQEIPEAQMNMKAVFLHVLGDALGSVIVMISATIVLLVPVSLFLLDTFYFVNFNCNALIKLPSVQYFTIFESNVVLSLG